MGREPLARTRARAPTGPMDIRTKLVFALVAASLGSMAVLGAVAYLLARDLQQDHALRQLEAMAESKKVALENVLSGWSDRVNLIASRTQLRASLRELGRSGDEAQRRRIERILDDARSSVATVRRIALFDERGTPVASRGDGMPAPRDAEAFRDAPGEARFGGVSAEPDGSLSATWLAPLRYDGEFVGLLEVVLNANELIEVAHDYTGLDETGETLIARREPGGGASIIHPVRHADHESRPAAITERSSSPLLRAAVEGIEDTYQDAEDYRGEEVWAATRALAEPGWGLVVKMDVAEENERALELRDSLVSLGLSLAALAIVLGTLLGLYIARPIRELADVAHRIRHGEFELRARVTTEDEVGELAETFNQMIEVLVQSHHEMEIRVGNEDDDADGKS